MAVGCNALLAEPMKSRLWPRKALFLGWDYRESRGTAWTDLDFLYQNAL